MTEQEPERVYYLDWTSGLCHTAPDCPRYEAANVVVEAVGLIEGFKPCPDCYPPQPDSVSPAQEDER